MIGVRVSIESGAAEVTDGGVTPAGGGDHWLTGAVDNPGGLVQGEGFGDQPQTSEETDQLIRLQRR